MNDNQDSTVCVLEKVVFCPVAVNIFMGSDLYQK